MAKYSKASQDKVHKSMDEMKKGKLTIGRSGQKVTNPKQAIAIGLSEARKKGAKVPPVTGKKAAPKKAAAKKSMLKKAAVKKAAPKKAVVKKAAPKKAVAKKSTPKKAAGRPRTRK